MQERVTYQKFYMPRNERENRVLKLVIFLLLIFLCVLFVCAFIAPFLFKNKNRKVFCEQTFYYVVLEKTKNKNNVEYLKAKVKNSGGAGYVFYDGGEYEIVGFAYKTKFVAEKIVSSVPYGLEAEIVERTVPKIKRKAQSEIVANIELFEAYKFISNVAHDFYDNIILYSKSKISDAEFYRWLEKNKIESENLLEKISNTKSKKSLFKSLSVEVSTMLLMVEKTFENVSNEIYKSGKADSIMKNGFVIMVEMWINMNENINKIR